VRELAVALIDHLVSLWGDLALVTPTGFATALRVVGNVPDDATPFQIESWVGTFGEVRVNAASPSLAGWGWSKGDSFVIETGRGRSQQERNITIPHEFGERLQHVMNDHLIACGLPAVDWGERFWDRMGIELVAPLAGFRTAALRCGLDAVDLADPLSREACVYRLKEAFADDVPLFVVYAVNGAEWKRGHGYEGDEWVVRASAWTSRWLSCGYLDRREILHLPRRGDRIHDDSLVREVGRKRRNLLVQTSEVADGRLFESTVILRGGYYGKEPAWVMAVGVERRFAHLISAQLALADPLERTGSFRLLF
jgi:hypothetical protein